MDVDFDSAAASNVDDWLACFSTPTSKPGAFPFTSHKIQSIESRRARMSDLLIFDVLLVRGGIRSSDMLFPPADWTALRKLLDAIDDSVYDVLKKDCLVYILLKWTWDIDPRETNTGWDARYVQDRCIPPQFAALADAYWLLDTGTHLAKAVSILSDARLNRDYVSKILQALSLSSSPAAFASGTAPATAGLVVKYVRTAKPLLTEPDDIDLYALSLAQLSFMDAWSYQQSFPEGNDTRERLLRKIVGWCLMPTPKQEPLAQLLAFPLSSYEQSTLHTLAVPSQFSASSSLSTVNTHTTTTPSVPVLSSQAMSILQDLLCVRAIQSGDYVGAIKLDRQFSSASLGGGASSSNIVSQATSSGIDRKSIIQELFATLPPAERTLLEDEIGKVATGVRANAPSTPRQQPSARRPPIADMSLSGSWEDVSRGMSSPTPSASLSSSAVGSGLPGKTTPVSASGTSKASQLPFSTSTSASPLAPRVPQPQPISGHRAPPTPKFTAFGSPIPPTTGMGTGRAVITERGKTLFSTGAAGTPSVGVKPPTRVSLFETAGSAKNAPNAFFKPPPAPAPATRATLDVGSALGSSATRGATQAASATNQNGKAQESDGEDVSMGSDVEGDHRDEAEEERDDQGATEDEEDADNFITHDKSGAADLTLHGRDVDDAMSEDEGGVDLGFSVFSGVRSVPNGNAGGGRKKSVSGNGHVPHASPPPLRASPPHEEDKSLGASVRSTTSRWRAPPGAFDQEEEDQEEQHENQNRTADEEGDEDDRMPQTTPISSPRRSTRTRAQPETPPRSSARSQPQRSSKTTRRPSTHARGSSSRHPRPSQTIPGALTDDDHDEHAQVTDHADTEEEEEEEDALPPLPSRASRRTRSSGFIGVPASGTTSKSTSGAKSGASKGKTKASARPSEVKTPARRSSRLSTASSLSPDHTEAASPTKKGRKSAGPRASVGGSGTVTTRSSTRRKR